MQQTPIASRPHVGIFGNTNAGKSSLFNAIIGQEMVIVSEHKGTTTDPVIKAMELIPFGPIALIDTAGIDDMGALGTKRLQKTKDILMRTDLAIYAVDINAFSEDEYDKMCSEFDGKSLKHLLVFTKCDYADERTRKDLKEKYQDAIFIDINNIDSITFLKQRIIEELQKIESKEETLIGDILAEGSTVIMVVPIDSAAPKGRLILPQVQFIRDCLDHEIKCLVTREKELEKTLLEIKKVDLVVTDSQIFKLVSKVVPRDIPLTSFSILLARQKGDIELLIDGVSKVEKLLDGAKILMAEGCTHNYTHEDIGRVKIPQLLQKHTGKRFNFEFYAGHDFPDNLQDFDFVIHCGGCMLNKKAVCTRLSICKDMGISVTNYGVLLAYLNGILPRCRQIFLKDWER